MIIVIIILLLFYDRIILVRLSTFASFFVCHLSICKSRLANPVPFRLDGLDAKAILTFIRCAGEMKNCQQHSKD